MGTVYKVPDPLENKQKGEEPEVIEEKADVNPIISKGTNNKLQHQQSLQSNRQDLDQSVELDVKPGQFNLQKIDLTINNKIDNYSGKIVGTTMREANGQLLAGVELLLYFGSGTEFPVHRTGSDENGNYDIPDLPPGFYTITARHGEMLCISRNIKILPGATFELALSLVPRVNNI